MADVHRDGPDVALVVTVRDKAQGGQLGGPGDVVDVWQREGRSGAELARILRRIAAGFEQNDLRRVQ